MTDLPRTVIKQDLLYSLGAFSTGCELSRNDAAWRLQQLLTDGRDPGVHPHTVADADAALAWLQTEHATLLTTQRAAVALGRHHVVWHVAWVLRTFQFWRGHWRDALAVWRGRWTPQHTFPTPPPAAVPTGSLATSVPGWA